jgi:hypothetical protein
MNIEKGGAETLKTHFVSVDEGLKTETLNDICDSLGLESFYDETVQAVKY